MGYKTILIAGSGVLGSQIAFQTALHGFAVTVYDINDEALNRAKARIQDLKPRYRADLGTTEEQAEAALARMTFQSDLAQAAADADLVIESVPESLPIKIEFYQKLAAVAPEKTIFATNSSTLLPSQFAEATGRPEKFLALHFANEIWKNNTAEIMKHATTDEQVFADVVEFAKAIGMVALPLQKEQAGYIVNSLLVPLLSSAQKLLVTGIADVETIDKTWMVATGAPVGPFGMLDIVGINTAYHIARTRAEHTGDAAYQAVADVLKRDYVDQGKLGKATGEGFYKYPNPSYTEPGFLKG
ncbi:3-hydroxyacyl-CoA dehydrogenase [Saccharibacillus alkalitolerans]|uniref:3-hydroxyacyl-CoA dehydrogenase n=1 Tax=Saccharibacillus alkalitolerans TaxID=2705290 RepID=A0ABX0F2E0_9BACL|nr:3-hydroxyacyl-CoA dehydrogenase [Saccharibacillus alkalitolerans]NGZ74590.1 3-hydroxyacyl-CoA dehydrogenase [Saccharibacillus alkalitolerans]